MIVRKTFLLISAGFFVLSVFVCGIDSTTSTHAEEGSVQKSKKPSTTKTVAELDGISKLLLVLGKSRAEALQLALGSGAKSVVIAMWDIDTKTASGAAVRYGLVEYRVTNGHIAETQLRIDNSQAQVPIIKLVYNEIMSLGKIEDAKTTKQKVFLTIPVRDKRALKVEMQRPPGGKLWWSVRFRPDRTAVKSVSGSKTTKVTSGQVNGANAGLSKTIAGIQVPVFVSSKQLVPFLKPRWKLLMSIDLMDVCIPYGRGKLVRSERTLYMFAPKGEATGVRAGVLNGVECAVFEKNQDYETMKAFVADIRRRGHITFSKRNFFVANVVMPTTGVKGQISASTSISSPEHREIIEKAGRELPGMILVGVSPPEKDSDTSRSKPANVKSDKPR